MLSTSWLRWLKWVALHHRTRQSQRRRPARRPWPFVPCLDLLENRTLPSTFTVSNLADSGPGSLRQAILDANQQPGADTIVFTPDLHGTITLTSDELSITDDLTIAGPGALRLAVSGNDAHRVFQVASNVHVVISDLTITHGAADLGGGILNDGGDLTLTDVVLSHNQAVGTADDMGGGGGAIRSLNSASLALFHCILTDNQAVGTSGLPVARGGGVQNAVDSSLTVDHSLFANNQALGSDEGGSGIGGAIENVSHATLHITASLFTGNRAIGGDAGSDGSAGQGVGGGLYIAAGGTVSSDQTVIRHNHASTNDDDVFGDLS